MLYLSVPESRFYDDELGFIDVKETNLQLEHSLVSISKWESKWKRAFLESKKFKDEELIDYVKCMTITQNVNPMVYMALTKENYEKVMEYIADSMTAIKFPESKGSSSFGPRDKMTSDLIYFYMVYYGIPIECQKWHLNRLLTLLRVCKIKMEPNSKKNKKDVANQYAELNRQRLAQFNVTG